MAVLKSTLRVGLDDRLTGKGRGMLGMLNRLSGAGRRMQSGLVGPQATAGIAAMTRRLVALGGAYIGIRNTLGAAFDFEDKFAEVRKVIDTTPAGLAMLREQILKMSTSLSGISAGGLTEIMAEAGQAGIAMERLGRFTEYTAKASVAFDMAAGETGNVFAKLGNVFMLNQQRLEHLANATNLLSNNMAAKASEILNFTNRAAGAADVLNLLPEQMAAVGAAMTSAGIVPETGARGLNAFANKMVKGGPKIERAFKSIGLSFKQWSKLKKENGPKAMQQLFDSLNKDSDGARAMQDLFGQDFSDDFGKLMKNPKLLGEAFRLAGNEARIAGSVQAEYVNKVDTSIGRIRRLGNQLQAVGIRLGDMAAGPLGAAAERISGIFDTLDQRVTVFDKIKAGLDGLAAGLGFTDAGSLASGFTGWLETGLFGKLGTFEQDTDRLGIISKKFMEIGQNFRSAFDAFSGGQGAGVAMAAAGEGLSKLGGALTLGGAIVLGLTAAKLLRFSGALVAFGFGSRLVRFGVIAAGLSQLAGAGGEMSAVDWAVSVAGVGMLGAELFKLGRGATAAYRGLKSVLTGAKVLGAGAATGAAAKSGLLSGLLANPLGAGAAALTGTTAFGMWAAANSDPAAKNKDLIGDAQRRARTGSGVPVMPRGDYTLGGFGGFRGAGRGAETGDGFINAPLAFRRSEAYVASLPSSRDGALTGGRMGPSDVKLMGQPIEAIVRPQGTQDVRVTNQPALNVPVSVIVHASSMADPRAIGNEVGRATGAAVGNALRESFAD